MFGAALEDRATTEAGYNHSDNDPKPDADRGGQGTFRVAVLLDEVSFDFPEGLPAITVQ